MLRLPSPRHGFPQFRLRLLEIVKEYGIDQVLPTCEEAFYVSRMKDDFPSQVKVWVPGFSAIRKLHQKASFNAWVKELGLDAPETTSVTSSNELQAHLRGLAGNQKWVLKPAYSRFAAHARIGFPSDLLSSVPRAASSPENPTLVQEWIQGKEYCTYAFADEGKVLAISTYHHEFRAGAGAGICFEPVFHSGIEAWIQDFVARTGVTGQISFDFIETAEGKLYPLECNPRATSGLHLLAGDPSFASLFLGQRPSGLIRPQRESAAMLGLAMWVYGLPSIRSLASLANWIRITFTARDCIFSWRDPFPFFYQFVMFGYFIALARRKGISELEATTEDIEWNGETIAS